MMMSKKRTSDELQKDVDVIKEKLQKMKKEQKKLERQEKAEREKIERQKQIEEALDLIKIAIHKISRFYKKMVCHKDTSFF